MAIGGSFLWTMTSRYVSQTLVFVVKEELWSQSCSFEDGEEWWCRPWIDAFMYVWCSLHYLVRRSRQRVSLQIPSPSSSPESIPMCCWKPFPICWCMQWNNCVFLSINESRHYQHVCISSRLLSWTHRWN